MSKMYALIAAQIMVRKQEVVNSYPNEPIHKLRASRSGDQRILCSSGTSCGGFLKLQNCERVRRD